MEEIIWGQYDFNYTSIDCNLAYADFSVYAHEYAHFSLTKNTLWGIAQFLVKHTADNSSSYALNKIIGLLTDASERTQESYAMYYQLLFASTLDVLSYQTYYDRFVHSPYYSKYKFSEFHWIADFHGLNREAGLLERICAIAMNVDLTDCENENIWSSSEQMFNEIKNNKLKYMPDYRLARIISLCSGADISSLHTLADSEIAKMAGIEYHDFTTESLLDMLERMQNRFKKANLPSTLIQRNIENIRHNDIKIGYHLPQSDDHIARLKQSILPECLNHRVQRTPLPAFPNSNFGNIEIITLYDFSEKCLCELTDFENSNRYSIISNIVKVNDYLESYNKTIQFYFDDYLAVLEHWTLLQNRCVYFILKNTYYDFKTLIANSMSANKEAFIYKLNEGVFFLFVRDKLNNVFYTYQSMLNIDAVLSDFEKGFFNFPNNDLAFVKENWQDYARILSHMSETNITKTSWDEFSERIITSTIQLSS